MLSFIAGLMCGGTVGGLTMCIFQITKSKIESLCAKKSLAHGDFFCIRLQKGAE